MVIEQGFYVSIVEGYDASGPVAGPFATLVEAALAMVDINKKDSDGRRMATEIFYADDDDNFYVRWKGRWVLEEDDGTVDPRAPLPDILKAVSNG